MFKRDKDKKMLLQIGVEQIRENPNQPRRIFDDAKLSELTKSIQQYGVLQPLCIRLNGKNEYELISGERRLRAAKAAGLRTVPCILQNIDSQNSCLIALIENLQREDLSFFEQAKGIERLITDYGMTQQEAAQKLSLSQSAVANKLRLLRLSPNMQERIENLKLTERHARALLRICSEYQREIALNEIIVKGYNAAETDAYIDRLLAPEETKPVNKMVVKDVRLFVNSINKAINVMKISGIDAKSERSETEKYIKYTVIIPKRKCDA